MNYTVGQYYGANKNIYYKEKLEDGRGRFICPQCKKEFICIRKAINKRKVCPNCVNQNRMKVHVGDVFERLTVLQVLSEKDNDNRHVCIVQCSCSDKTVFKTNTHRLLTGNTKSCGCLQREWAVKKNKQGCLDITGQKFGKLTAVKDTGVSSSNGHIWLFDCDCGKKNIPIALGNVHRKTRIGTLSCGCLKQSKGEYLIQKALEDLSENFIAEYSFSDCVNPKTGSLLRFDFFLPQRKCCIEFDGLQHFAEQRYNPKYWWGSVDLQQIKDRDEIKDNYCLDNEIELIRIPYTDINKIDTSFLLSLLGGEHNNNI